MIYSGGKTKAEVEINLSDRSMILCVVLRAYHYLLFLMQFTTIEGVDFLPDDVLELKQTFYLRVGTFLLVIFKDMCGVFEKVF